ncbi:MAG: FGGY family carbohydrate kinase [Lachnospiraceae bacterium]|nr:FGGY family carbohydrate kinase [Lachnospiraceae bacterium]
MTGKKVLAVDMGASGGKMAFAVYSGGKAEVLEYRSFANRPVDIGSALYWDVFSLYNSILDGISYFHSKYGKIETIGIDAWGASYGLLDRKGRLLEPVYHYRDIRTENVMERMQEVCSPHDLFQLTGCQCNRTYTLPQLYACVSEPNSIIDKAEKMLFLPDLLSYFLTGSDLTEMTIAGTSGLLDSSQENWSSTVADKFGIPFSLYTELTDPGTVKGSLRKEVEQATGTSGINLVSVVGHDSASAVASIPGFDENHLYISVGTNISMGVESEECLLSEQAFAAGMKNTGGFARKKIIYRDFSACWHINEFLRTRREQGICYTFAQLDELARSMTADVPWIDTEDSVLCEAGGDFCRKIDGYCDRTNQRRPESDAEYIRCIYESIALKTAHYSKLFRKTGFPCRSIYVISGGTKNELLMQLMADALGKEITAGMPYATLNGNILTQLYALGEAGSLKEMRQISASWDDGKQYFPEDREMWDSKSGRYEALISGFTV